MSYTENKMTRASYDDIQGTIFIGVIFLITSIISKFLIKKSHAIKMHKYMQTKFNYKLSSSCHFKNKA